jgi:pyruvate dehydrogenase E1 component
MNENYAHPDMPEGAEEGILKGMYLLREGAKDAKTKVQLMGSGTILREVMAAADLLRDDWGVDADIWSVTSFNELKRDAMAAERWNLLHPTDAPKKSWIDTALDGRSGPFIAATDYVRNFADQVRGYLPGSYTVLGTDGFGRSDTRKKLRRFFEVDRFYVTLAALTSLAKEGKVAKDAPAKAIAKYGIDPNKPAPWTV